MELFQRLQRGGGEREKKEEEGKDGNIRIARERGWPWMWDAWGGEHHLTQYS
jgi:hypothetical protein